MLTRGARAGGEGSGTGLDDDLAFDHDGGAQVCGGGYRLMIFRGLSGRFRAIIRVVNCVSCNLLVGGLISGGDDAHLIAVWDKAEGEDRAVWFYSFTRQ